MLALGEKLRKKVLRGSLMNGEVPIHPSFPPTLGSDAGFRALPCPASTALMGCARAPVVPTTPRCQCHHAGGHPPGK